MRVSGIFIYPVKSLAGIQLETVEVDELGLASDRRFMVVDENGRFLTQRALPKMALIATAISDDTLTLSARGAGEIRVHRASDPAVPQRTVSVWRSEGLRAEDCGDPAAAWLSAFSGRQMPPRPRGCPVHRPVKNAVGAQADDRVGFADGFPFLVISEGSLADLNDRLVERGGDALPMDRFRPNLVVSGCPAFAEDHWARVRVGKIVLRAAGACARCIVTTTNQQTAVRGVEPLRTLATYRRDANDPTDVNFGQNFIHENKARPAADRRFRHADVSGAELKFRSRSASACSSLALFTRTIGRAQQFVVGTKNDGLPEETIGLERRSLHRFSCAAPTIRSRAHAAPCVSRDVSSSRSSAPSEPVISAACDGAPSHAHPAMPAPSNGAAPRACRTALPKPARDSPPGTFRADNALRCQWAGAAATRWSWSC
jgi:uncharacterized protein YcbX